MPGLYVLTAGGLVAAATAPGPEGPVSTEPSTVPGPPGLPNVLSKGTVTTGAPGSDADFTIAGTSPEQTLSLVIPRGDVGPKGDKGDVGSKGSKGDTGDEGPGNTLTIGTVTTGAASSAADANIFGASPNQTLDLTIPRGDTGAASTVPGPPNTLTVGSVTTGAPGSAADADISGTSPEQTLDLVIPRGDVGPQGETRYLVQDGAAYPARPFPAEVPVTFVGSANPDLLGVMVVGDSWINTAADQVVPYVKHYDGAGSPEGVVTAQIGSRYIDVNATRGAVEWIKASGTGNTGWKVAYGDTGQRDMASLLDPTYWTAGPGAVTLRREGSRVVVNSSPSSAGAVCVSAGSPNIFLVPVGFRPQTTSMGPVRLTDGVMGTVEAVNYGTYEVRIRIPTVMVPTRGYQFTLSYTTSDPWPLTLPGV